MNTLVEITIGSSGGNVPAWLQAAAAFLTLAAVIGIGIVEELRARRQQKTIDTMSKVRRAELFEAVIGIAHEVRAWADRLAAAAAARSMYDQVGGLNPPLLGKEIGALAIAADAARGSLERLTTGLEADATLLIKISQLIMVLPAGVIDWRKESPPTIQEHAETMRDAIDALAVQLAVIKGPV